MSWLLERRVNLVTYIRGEEELVYIMQHKYVPVLRVFACQDWPYYPMWECYDAKRVTTDAPTCLGCLDGERDGCWPA